jgi:hypothetical protein
VKRRRHEFCRAGRRRLRLNTESKPNEEHRVRSEGSRDRSVAGSELNEDQALAIVSSPEVSREKLVSLSRATIAGKSRKVALALATHPRTPRHISIPLVRRMFTFDLRQVSLIPALAADIKRAAEDEIIMRLKSLTAGERISLARRAPRRVLAALLADPDTRVVSAVLDNPRLVESSVVASLGKPDAPQVLFTCTGQHPRWSERREVQMALLKSEKTPPQLAGGLAKHFSRQFLDKILPESRRSRDS